MTAERVAPGDRPGERYPALPGIDVDDLVLRIVGQSGVDVRDIVTRASLTRSLVGASTIELEILDEDRTLLRSGILTRTIDVEVGGLWFRLSHVGKRGDRLSLTLEDRAVVILRGNVTPRKASRSKMTRAQFAQTMVAESKRYPIEFYTPQLAQRQPIAAASRASRAERDANRERGIDTGASLKVKGAKADRRQLRNAEALLSVAEELRASALPTLALICAAIGESTMGADPNTFRGKYQGVLQGNPANIDVRDPRALARAFLLGGKGFQAGGAIKLARENPGISAGEIATRVEASGEPADFYGRHADEAQAIIAAYGGASGGTTSGTYYARYEFSRGEPGGQKGEDTWMALQRLAREVGWVCFVVANTVFFIAEEDLFRGRSRATITEDTPGVLSIDFDRETNRRLASEATIECLADMWAAPQGSVVRIEGCGPADGRWLVDEITRADLFDDATTITLSKPAEELPEPRSDRQTRDTAGAYPLRGTRGKLIGVPHQGTHTLGNWQSDNAVDLGTPDGTIVQAVADGTVEKVKGSYSGGASRFDGFQVTIRVGSNRVWYTHLSTCNVRAGESVRAGEAIGRSGSANGVAHLHFSCEHGDPRDLIGLR